MSQQHPQEPMTTGSEQSDIPAPASATATPARDSAAVSGVTSGSSLTQPRKPRTGTIFWGAFYLIVTVFFALQQLAPNRIDAMSFGITAAIGLGVLFLVVAVAMLLRKSKD